VTKEEEDHVKTATRVIAGRSIAAGLTGVTTFCLAVTCFFAIRSHAADIPDAANSDAFEPRISEPVRQFTKEYCWRCHNPDKRRGGVDIESLGVELSTPAQAQNWQDVLDVINLGEMPPEDTRHPATEMLSDFIKTLTADLMTARKYMTDRGDRVVIRRLNKREFINSIRTLTGYEIEPSNLPDDENHNGFDTVGSALGTSALHFDFYAQEIENAVQSLQRFEHEPETRTKAFSPEGGIKRLSEVRKSIDGVMEKLTFLENGNDPLGTKYGRYTDHVAPDTKAERIKMSLEHHRAALRRVQVDENMAEQSVKHQRYVHSICRSIPNPLRIPPVHNAISIRGLPDAKYRVTFRCGLISNSIKQRTLFLYLYGRAPDNNQRIVAVERLPFAVNGTLEDPGTIQFEFTKKPLQTYVAVSMERSNMVEDDSYLWVDEFELTGPFKNAGHQIHESMFGTEITSAEQAWQVIERFALKAYRNSNDAVKAKKPELLEAYLESVASGSSAEEAVKQCLIRVLVSPHFQYVVEPAGDRGKRPLTERELAIRLALFLWSDLPDDRLWQRVNENALRESLDEEVERMLKHPKADNFYRHFIDQWIGMSKYYAINKKAFMPKKYLGEEPVAFFRHLVTHNLSLGNFIDSDFMMVNSVTADYYNIAPVASTDFVPVPISDPAQRGGLLGQAAIAIMKSGEKRTSPVDRGAFIRRKFLNNPPGSPPPNVPVLTPKDTKGKTIREALKVHIEIAQCRSCHLEMDQLGLAMENLDRLGHWRTEENGQPILTEGAIDRGKTEFRDFKELRQALMLHRNDFIEGFTEAMIIYSLGRKVSFADADEIDRIVQEAGGKNHRSMDFIKTLVKSTSFQHK